MIIHPKSYVVDVVAYVDLIEMYLFSGNVRKHFVVASRFSGRTLLITPSKNYVVDEMDKVAYDWPKDVVIGSCI
ncbi:hypothetical protein H5410_025939 [Solanum commersonii]|uniref:Uncharacterized protein n=1 Tax=Solanum commersonii TaxID=4109 RepID=A0A9J5YXG9_SOLCO|nr:hypothetical protein H5410_025939 [Solanum commersonii]